MGISYEKFEVSDISRVKNKEYLKKVISATKAAKLIPHGALIGFGGFVGAGAPIVVPMALAQRAEKLHADGKEFQIKALTGASTDPNLDGKQSASRSLRRWSREGHKHRQSHH